MKIDIRQIVCALLGLGFIALQVYKYATDTLELSITEALATLAAMLLVFAPAAMVEAGKKILRNFSKGKENEVK